MEPSACLERRTLTDTDDTIRFGFGKNIVVNVIHDSSNFRQRDSSKTKTKRLSDYKWENKTNYLGKILAVRDKLIAYRLFNENTGEAVRVLQRETRARHLIKDFNSAIVDLQWAVHAPFLAILDINLNIYIYNVDEECKKLIKYINIINNVDLKNVIPKLFWCPYIMEESLNNSKDMHMLAVSRGNYVDIFYLHVIKNSITIGEIEYNQILTIPNALLTLDLQNNTEITSLKLSPDATAMAIATTDGDILFYVIDSGKIRFANSVRPLPNSFAEDIVFLDNLSVQNQDQFWKYVAILSDSGRRIAIYDSDNWNCLAKIRFELQKQINHLDFYVDQSAHFIFLADCDSSFLYCIELNYISMLPCFTACTQISYHNPLICIVPCTLVKNFDDDLLLDDTEEAKCTISAIFIAVTQRSIVETNVELEHYQLNPNSLIFGTATSITSTLDNTSHEVLGRYKKNETTSTAVAAKDLAAILNISKGSNLSSKQVSNNNNSNSFSSTQKLIDYLKKFQDNIDERFAALTQHIKKLESNVERLEQENKNLQKENFDELAQAMERIVLLIKTQNDRNKTLFEDSKIVTQNEIISAIDSALCSKNEELQGILESGNLAYIQPIRNMMEELVVPAVESICNQLFQQLNETLHEGLQEFMDQLTVIQKESVTYDSSPAIFPNNKILLQLIQTGHILQAFEMALSSKDLMLLMLVCNKVDPDNLFSNSTQPQFPTNILLDLLQQLSQKLENETDIKFRYIENILICLGDNSEKFDTRFNEEFIHPVMESLSQALNVFAKKDIDAVFRRKARLMNQLASNLLKSVSSKSSQ